MGWSQLGDDGPGVDLTPLLTWLLTPTGLLSLLATLVVVLDAALAADIDDEIAGIAGTAYLRDRLRTQGWRR